MPITVKRSDLRFNPNPSRVIARFFLPTGHTNHKRDVVKRILALPESEVEQLFRQVMRDFSRRHRNITKIFLRHFENVKHIFGSLKLDPETLSEKRKLLIGAYFTKEYSIESAAFFNPSIVEDIDQTNLQIGEKRVILSLRATGEGHISSIVFRKGVLNKHNVLEFEPFGPLVDVPEIVKRHVYEKRVFLKKLKEMDIQKDIVDMVMNRLKKSFTYGELQASIHNCSQIIPLSYSKKKVLQVIHWLASSHYEIFFSLDTSLSDRVIFPISYAESNGIEDARFVRFVDDDGSVTYYATYTAYNGFTILPKLLETKDFYHFKVSPINGDYVQNKGMALFPRRIKGNYVMASRFNGENNYVMFSQDIKLWRNVTKIAEPIYPWELVQVGNGGSPMETEKGWLMVTHGVGPMRRYCLGLLLLDLENPTRVIAHLKEPLLMPTEEEREGYVPNVLYTCGAIIHNNELVIPYGVADSCYTYATISMDEIFSELFKSDSRQAKISVAHKHRTILVVDDEVLVQQFITKILTDEGYDVEVASDGADALMSIGRKNFDLVLLDVNMPAVDGLQLLGIMKKKGIVPPIIVISGSDRESLNDSGLEENAIFMQKPLETGALLRKIQEILKN